MGCLLPCDANGNPDYKSFIIVTQVCGMFAALIYTTSVLSGSSAITALTAFTITFSTGMWIIKKAEAFLWRIDKLGFREEAVVVEWKYLENFRDRAKMEIKARLSTVEKPIYQLHALLKECQQLCKIQIHEERAKLYAMMDIERLKLFLEASFKMKYNVTKDDSVCTKVMGEIVMALTCPIALDLPEDPVVSSTGIVYSSALLKRHFNHTRSQTCPITNTPMAWYAKALPVTEICEKLRQFAYGTQYPLV